MSKHELGDGEPSPSPRTKAELIDWLAKWRQERGGSVSEHNHRRLLQERTVTELNTMYQQIVSQESGAAQEVSPPSPEPENNHGLPKSDGGSRENHEPRGAKGQIEASHESEVMPNEPDRYSNLSRLAVAGDASAKTRAEGDTRELKAALKKFGQHNRDCSTRRPNVGDAPPCDCGFQRVYEGL